MTMWIGFLIAIAFMVSYDTPLMYTSDQHTPLTGILYLFLCAWNAYIHV